MVQRASTEVSMGVSPAGEIPIIMTRLCDESGWIICGGLETFGIGVRLGELLLHELARVHDVRAGLEEQDDRRLAGDGLRAQDADPGRPVEQVGLERDRDELLDLLGRQPERLGLDLDVRGRELGQDVDRRVAQLREAEDEDRGRDGHHQDPESQARTDDRSHGRSLSYGAVIGSAGGVCRYRSALTR